MSSPLEEQHVPHRILEPLPLAFVAVDKRRDLRCRPEALAVLQLQTAQRAVQGGAQPS